MAHLKQAHCNCHRGSKGFPPYLSGIAVNPGGDIDGDNVLLRTTNSLYDPGKFSLDAALQPGAEHGIHNKGTPSKVTVQVRRPLSRREGRHGHSPRVEGLQEARITDRVSCPREASNLPTVVAQVPCDNQSIAAVVAGTAQHE
ncbi:MAG TPA: hypothetical protein VFR15_03490, partial [Chloroflexia bacterium]|nr:hypothetical protein [Chloroflexia bacterium]